MAKQNTAGADDQAKSAESTKKSTTKSSDAAATDLPTINPDATAPSNDPNRDESPTATEPNTKERLASRTGRKNGGDDTVKARRGLNRPRDQVTRLGEREAVPPSDHDVIWTNASKDRWGVDQPSIQDQLRSAEKSRKLEAESRE